jgi:hypothetical protein
MNREEAFTKIADAFYGKEELLKRLDEESYNDLVLTIDKEMFSVFNRYPKDVFNEILDKFSFPSDEKTISFVIDGIINEMNSR